MDIQVSSQEYKRNLSSKRTILKRIDDLKYKSNHIRILVYFLMAFLAIEMFSIDPLLKEIKGLSRDGLDMAKPLVFITLLLIWFNIFAVMLLMFQTFFNLKIVNKIRKYCTLPIIILSFINFGNNLVLTQGNLLISVYAVSYAFMLITEFVLSIFYLKVDGTIEEEKADKRTVIKTILIGVLLCLCVMPLYFVQSTYGYTKAMLTPIDISFTHRLLIYSSLLIPFILYFCLRNESEDVIRFALIYISIATMIGFLINYDYTDFAKPWSWPFHLCNTAVFVVPLVLIFRLKRLFYFTYFINVFGALLAMLMPNYSSSSNLFDMGTMRFWSNHLTAFFMPLLIVALKQFPRPKIKQFYYSMVWFLVYFLLALVMNVVFTELGHDVDYFFINSNYIASKLGTYFEQLFLINSSITIAGHTFVFHPIYQILFFITYVLIGFGVWFVYSEMFKVADRHYDMKLRIEKVKMVRFAKKNVPNKEEIEMMKNQNLEAKFELVHFSKKYATSKIYAVHDANLDVHAGEIFGFLGPNGAGKSSIIKSVVGIQPISEGNIKICGYDVAADPVQSKYNIGYVPDHYALYEQLTGREYINYIADIYHVSQEDRNERLNKYIKIFELDNSIDSKIKTYSHGMKQKITIMSALVHNPKVWILDEPLTGLDPNSIYQVKECMKLHAKEGNIVFFSSHIIDIVEKLCQRIAIIKHGEIQCVKTIEEIEASGKSLEEFYLETIGQEEKHE